MWTLDDALTLIRPLQKQLHTKGFHLALGGGVLNNGHSDKDLDLYLFAFDMPTRMNNQFDVLAYLEELWGTPAVPMLRESVWNCEYPPAPGIKSQVKFLLSTGQRIDVFLAG